VIDIDRALQGFITLAETALDLSTGIPTTTGPRNTRS
jgi:hypothetical protein